MIDKFGNSILERFADAKRVIFLGSSFKVGSDDIRQSRTLKVIQKILQHAKFEICLLDEPAAYEILKIQKRTKILKSSDITNDDHLVIMLKNEEYLNYLEKVPTGKIINIPIL